MSILFIHIRRGLFQLTKCQNCGYTFGCDNCNNRLTTYRANSNQMELICHQCQSFYKYPNSCPKCMSKNIISLYGGIEDLGELLEKEYKKEVIRLDVLKKYQDINKIIDENVDLNKVFLSTRIFDPAISYSKFSKIIFIKAENILASSDYLVREDTLKNLTEIFLQIDTKTQVIFDTNSLETEFFQDLQVLENMRQNDINPLKNWYLEMLKSESKIREQFLFPPYKHLVLLTSNEKIQVKSLQKMQTIRNYLQKCQKDFPEIQITPPYPARFLKRKNLFSYHLLIKYPRDYQKFFKLQKLLRSLSSMYYIQIRLNPKHLF